MQVLRKRGGAATVKSNSGKMSNGLYIHSSPPRVLNVSSAQIKQLIHGGDIDKLEQLVLAGHGKKLIGEYSADYKTRVFLKSVPNLMTKCGLLHDAVNGDKLDELKNVLDEEPDKKKRYVMTKDESGVGLLHKAVYYDLKNIYKYLIDKFPHIISMKDAEGRTAYHYTSMCKDSAAIQKMLINAGCDSSALDLKQHSAKYYVNHPQELELPSAHKTPNESRKSTGRKESLNFKKSNIRIWIHQRNLANLQQVVWEGHGSKLLVEHSNNPKIRKFLEAVPHIMGLVKDIHTDVQNDDLESLKSRVSPPIPPIVLSGKDNNGLTPLHKAAGLGKQDIAEYIVSQNPKSVNLTDNEGRTPLHYAALLKDGDKMTNFLIENGADESALDNKQKTAAYYKTRNSELDIKALTTLPECPRSAKENFGANFDWSMLTAVTPTEEISKAVKKIEKFFGHETEKDDHKPVVEELKNDTTKHEEKNTTNEEVIPNGHHEEQVEEKVEEAEKPEETKPEDSNEENEEKEEQTDEVDKNNNEENESNGNIEADEAKHDENEAQIEEDKPNEESANEVAPKEEDEQVEENHPEQNGDDKLEDIAETNDADEKNENEKNEERNPTPPATIEDTSTASRPSSNASISELKTRPNSIKSIEGKSNTIEQPEINGHEHEHGDHNGKEEEEVESEGVIEGVVNGENEVETLNEEGQGQSEDKPEDEEVQALVEAGNMEQLAALVLNGEGEKLVGEHSDNPELQSFLDNVPVYMAKINRIHVAARNGSLRDLQAALDRRKFAIAKDSISVNGASPLHVAVVFGNTSIVRYLAGRFPETVQVSDDNGRTPLHYAATLADNGHYYNLLVHLGANTRSEDKLGNPPEYYRSHHEEMSHKSLLTDFGAEEALTEEILADKVSGDDEGDVWSARKDFDDEDMLTVLERCYNVLHGRRNSNTVSAASTATNLSSVATTSCFLAKHLKRYIFDMVKLRLTKLDHNLYDLIWPSVKKLPTDASFRIALEQDFPAGIVAPDFYVYKIFGELLEPIIKELNSIDLHTELVTQPESKFVEDVPSEENEENKIVEVNLDLDPNCKWILSDNNYGTGNGQVDMPFFATEEGRYLASSLGDPLIKGLTEVANKRPEDPIAYLATYLYNFANTRSNLKSRGRTQENQQTIKGPPQITNDNTAVPATIDVVTLEPEENTVEDDSAFNSTSRDEHGQSMLHFAAARAHGRNALFQLLLETEINVAYRDELYRTARDISIQANLPDNTSEIDRYVMNIATKGDTDKLVELLLDGYEHITDIVDEDEMPIAEAVSKHNQPDTVSFLQSILTFEEKRERVHHAIRLGSINDVTKLLADENETGSGKLLAIGKNSYGRCTLHIAVLCQQEEIVDYLANTFPDTLRLGDNLERTALHYAMGVEKMESISRVLIKSGAKRVVKDLKGRQPTYYFLNKSDILRLQEEEETF